MRMHTLLGGSKSFSMLLYHYSFSRGGHHPPHFVDGKTEVQRGGVTCPRSKVVFTCHPAPFHSTPSLANTESGYNLVLSILE